MRVGEPGEWVLTFRYVVAETGETFTAKRESVSNAGAITWVCLVLTHPLPLAGQVQDISPDNCSEFYVEVPALGLAAPLSPRGDFVLNGLPPGRSQLVLSTFTRHPEWPRYPRTLDVDVRTGSIQFVDGLRATPW